MTCEGYSRIGARKYFYRRVALVEQPELSEHPAEVDTFRGLEHVVPQGLVAAPAGQRLGGVIDCQKDHPATAEGALRQQRRLLALPTRTSSPVRQACSAWRSAVPVVNGTP